MRSTPRRRIAAKNIVNSELVAAIGDTSGYKYNDSHFHLTNYVQEGTNIKDYVAMMGNVVKRSTLFGIPLQQMWQYGNTGDFAPTYYLQTDSPLYYYSFTDAFIAMAYKSLTPEQQARLDPMITAFNPADMYAADHIKRVLLTFPGVFTGIGEFSIHKEFVSSKVAGGVATLPDQALHRILDFAGEVGLVVILHNDADMPFPRPDQEPYVLLQFKELLLKHPNTTIIWAHVGLGRIVRPVARAHPTVVGIFHYGRRRNYVTPMDAKITQEIVIPPGMEKAILKCIARDPNAVIPT